MTVSTRFPSLRWTARLTNLVLPARCPLCAGRSLDRCGGLFCNDCRARYLADSAERCPRCALGLTGLSSLCGRCLTTAPAFDASCAATHYQPPIDLLVRRLKFGAQLPLAAAFAAALLEPLRRRRLDDCDLVLPVPLSADRLAERGFNQAIEIARPLARALGLPLAAHACVRVRDTAPQSMLALADRQDNMRGAFAVRDRAAVSGRRVLVIDDVMTTGHTLDALAACLKRHGATRVVNAVFARTPLR